MSALGDFYIHLNYQNYQENPEGGWLIQDFNQAHREALQKAVVDDFNKRVHNLWDGLLQQANQNSDLKKMIQMFQNPNTMIGSAAWLKNIVQILNQDLPAARPPQIGTNLREADPQKALENLQTRFNNYKNIFNNLVQFLQTTPIRQDPALTSLTTFQLQNTPFPMSNRPNTTITPQQYTRYLNQLTDIQKKLIQSSSIQNIDQIQDGTALAFQILNSLRPIIGYAAEDWMGTQGNIELQNFIQKWFPNSNITVTLEETGNKKSDYRVQTTDLSLHFQDKTGQLDIIIPYLSLKRGNKARNNTSQGRIDIKTSSLEQLLKHSLMADNQPALRGFFQAFATRGLCLDNTLEKQLGIGEKLLHSITQNSRKIPLTETGKTEGAMGQDRVTMHDVYNYVHMAILPTALAGDLSENDLASIFVFNDQIYTIANLLQASDITNYIKGIGPGVQRDIRKRHYGFIEKRSDKATIRSTNIYKEMLKTELTITFLKSFFLSH